MAKPKTISFIFNKPGVVQSKLDYGNSAATYCKILSVLPLNKLKGVNVIVTTKPLPINLAIDNRN